MKHLCLLYDEERKLAAMPKEEGEAFVAEYFDFNHGIRGTGQDVAGEALHSRGSERRSQPIGS